MHGTCMGHACISNGHLVNHVAWRCRCGRLEGACLVGHGKVALALGVGIRLEILDVFDDGMRTCTRYNRACYYFITYPSPMIDHASASAAVC